MRVDPNSPLWLSAAWPLMPGLKGARLAAGTGKAIKSLPLARLYLFSSSLLHTYLVPNSPAHDLGASVWKACIAQRGVDPRSIVLRGHRGRNF